MKSSRASEILRTALILSTWTPFVTAYNATEIFSKPIYARIYNGEQYDLANSDRATGNRVDIDTAASALAALEPSYVCSLIYISATDNLTNSMVSDFNTVRSAVLKSSPNAKFDVEINLVPQPFNGKPTFTSADQVVEFMQKIDDQLKVDGWWFDFYSDAQKAQPDWIVAAAAYAHGHNQTIGGNVFDDTVPPSSDAVSFVDKPANTSFGFGWDAQQVTALKHNSTSTIMLGHLQSNPQNGNTTESCVYMDNWNSTERAEYLEYWLSKQSVQGFTYMLPVFFPLCPGAYAFNPLVDQLPTQISQSLTGSSNATFYDLIRSVALGNASTSTSTSPTTYTTSASATATTHANDAAANVGRPGLPMGVMCWCVYGLLVLL